MQESFDDEAKKLLMRLSGLLTNVEQLSEQLIQDVTNKDENAEASAKLTQTALSETIKLMQLLEKNYQFIQQLRADKLHYDASEAVDEEAVRKYLNRKHKQAKNISRSTKALQRNKAKN